MLSMRLNEKWQAIMATAGAASRSTVGRSGPIVRAPAARLVAAISGGSGAVACYQHERVVVALEVTGDGMIGNLLRRVGEHERVGNAVFYAVGIEDDGIAPPEATTTPVASGRSR